MSVLRPILADQLSFDLPSLSQLNPKTDILVFCEVRAETDYVPHHPQKIIFLFSAMRHFAKSCKDMGFQIHYVELDDPKNTQNLIHEWERIAQLYQCSRVSLTMPGEWRLSSCFLNWQSHSNLSIELLEDTRFLCSHEEFSSWAKTRKQLRMEYFYQMMRKKYQILLEDSGHPVGGRWNFDIENRDPLKDKPIIKARLKFAPDKITQEVIALVKKEFSHHFGDCEPFSYACTAEEAHLALEKLFMWDLQDKIFYF
jgi:deoxyribodipyrimidine photolyase-related protein